MLLATPEATLSSFDSALVSAPSLRLGWVVNALLSPDGKAERVRHRPSERPRGIRWKATRRYRARLHHHRRHRCRQDDAPRHIADFGARCRQRAGSRRRMPETALAVRRRGPPRAHSAGRTAWAIVGTPARPRTAAATARPTGRPASKPRSLTDRSATRPPRAAGLACQAAAGPVKRKVASAAMTMTMLNNPVQMSVPTSESSNRRAWA